MTLKSDMDDRKLSLGLFLGLVVVILVVGAGVFFVVGPALAEAVAPGLGLKTSAIIAFALSLFVVVLMAIVAGDGLIGEIQYMILGFFAFFVICWLMIAWIF